MSRAFLSYCNQDPVTLKTPFYEIKDRKILVTNNVSYLKVSTRMNILGQYNFC